MNLKFFTAIAASAFIFFACATTQPQTDKKPRFKDVYSFPDGSVLNIKLAGNDLKLVVANSPKAKADGLSNKEEVPEDGMIFFFYEPSVQSFWMKDMKIAVDMIWVDGNEVIGVEKNVQPPIPHAKLEDLKIYRSNDKADIVIELEAGAADKLKIEQGSVLEMSAYQNLNNDNGEEND